MKKTFTLIVAVAISAGSYAQSLLGGMTTIVETTREVPTTLPGVGAAGTNDTLGLEDFLLATPSLYQTTAGYASGTVLSVDTFNVPPVGEVVATTTYVAFAEGYLINDEYSLLGAMFFAGVAESVSGTNPNVTVTAQLIQDNKAISDPSTVQNPDIPGPGQTLATATVALEDVAIDPNGNALLPTFVDFTSTPFVDADFCIVVNIANLYNGTPIDTLAIITTADGEGDDEYTYHRVDQQAQGLGGATIWTPTSAMLQVSPGSGVNINFAMFPIVTEYVGIEDIGYFDGVKMQAYPSPALSSDNVRIDFALENAKDNVTINIYAMDGQQVFTSALGAKASGTHSLYVPAGTLAAGTYVYSIQADGSRMAKRMEILK